VRIVLDTGILISALITEYSPPQQLYDAWICGAFELILSVPQLDEIRRVIHYPKLQRYFSPGEAELMVAQIVRHAVFATDLPTVTLSPDPEDNVILATALAGKAHYLVSGDKKGLLVLQQVESIPIITAREALAVIAL